MSKRFVFVITDAQHAALEAYRAKHRLRSMGHAARHMIEATMAPIVRAPEYQAAVESYVEEQEAKASWREMERAKVGKVKTVLLSNGPSRPKPGSLLKKR